MGVRIQISIAPEPKGYESRQTRSIVTPLAVSTIADVIFVRTAMALDAIAVITDAFLDVLAPNVVCCVFVAAIAGVALVIVAHMAGHATGIVVLVEQEIFIVIEGRRRPPFLAVALAAIAGNLLM